MEYVKLNHDFQKFLEPNYYAEILEKDDETVTVLRLQLLCEQFLNVYLEERVCEEQREFFVNGRGKKAELLKYFNEKLTVAIAFGLPVELANALRHLNKIRNIFAHSFDAKLEEPMVHQYFNLVDNFKVEGSEPYGLEEPVSETTIVSSGKKIKANGSLKLGLISATFVLMTKAGIWLVNDLNERGQLNVEPCQVQV